jgi:hypothetical protein
MSKSNHEAAELRKVELELARRLLEKLKAKSAKAKAEYAPSDIPVATSPYKKKDKQDAEPKRDNTPGPKPAVPNRQITSTNLLGLIDDTLKNAEKGMTGPIDPGLGLKQQKSSPKFPARSEWTITKIPTKEEQVNDDGRALQGDNRIAFYASAPGEERKDLPITIKNVKEFGLVPPAIDTEDRKGK